MVAYPLEYIHCKHVTPQVSRNPRILHNYTTRNRNWKFRQQKPWSEHKAEATIDIQYVKAWYSDRITLSLTNCSKGSLPSLGLRTNRLSIIGSCKSVGYPTKPFPHALFKGQPEEGKIRVRLNNLSKQTFLINYLNHIRLINHLMS